MRKISNAAELKASIRELELRTLRQEQAIKENTQSTAKSLRPTNLLKIGVKNFRMTPDMKTTALNTFIGLLAGTITRKLVIGKNPNILKRTLGSALQAGITRYIYKKLPTWQYQTTKLLSNRSTNRRSRY